MLMSVSELNGLGDLGKFSLKKTIKKLNPITVTKKAVALVTHPKALIAAVKANNPIVVAKASIALAKEYNPAAVAKNTIELGKAVAKQQLAVTKKLVDPREHIKLTKQVLHSPAVQNILKAAVVVVAGYFTGGAAVAPLMKLWMADREKREGRALNAQQEAEAAQAEAGIRSEMLAGGYSSEQANQVIGQIHGGADPAAALQSIGPPNPVVASAAVAAAAPSISFADAYAEAAGSAGAPMNTTAMPAPSRRSEVLGRSVPVSLSSEDVMQSKQSKSREQFLQWFRGWKPAEAAALQASNPELFEPLSVDTAALSGFDDDLGDWSGPYLGDWSDTFSSWGDAISNALPTVLSTATSLKTLQVQLARAKAGQPPLPTVQATAIAAGKKPGGIGLPLSMPMVIGGVVVLGIAAAFLAPGLFRRRHHSRFI